MKKLLVILFAISIMGHKASAQKVDSIYFNLYTDSLKKGTFNYINVEGRFSDGHYLPLTDKELSFTSSAGTFDRNSLFLDTSVKVISVKVKAVVRADPSLSKEMVIYIKRSVSTERLPTVDEIMSTPARRRRS